MPVPPPPGSWGAGDNRLEATTLGYIVAAFGLGRRSATLVRRRSGRCSCGGVFVLCGGRHADAVWVGTLCTRWYIAGGCCVRRAVAVWWVSGVIQLTSRITRIGFSRADLDVFAAGIQKPRHGVTKLPRNFCLERRQPSQRVRYCRCCIYFCMKVLVPSGRFLEECQCLMHAKAAMDILTYPKVGSCRSAREAKV